MVLGIIQKPSALCWGIMIFMNVFMEAATKLHDGKQMKPLLGSSMNHPPTQKMANKGNGITKRNRDPYEELAIAIFKQGIKDEETLEKHGHRLFLHNFRHNHSLICERIRRAIDSPPRKTLAYSAAAAYFNIEPEDVESILNKLRKVGRRGERTKGNSK